MPDKLDDYRWLVSEAAAPWLAIARADVAKGGVSPGLVGRLRKELSAERAHVVALQVELRARAREKFARADQMFFTRRGLEQATDERLATYKAARFPADEATADLCCGLGGDLIALGQRGRAVGVELDPVAALLAEVNLEVHGLARERCSVLVGDAVQVQLALQLPWHCDPDRRAAGRRTTQVELSQPSLADLDRLLAATATAAIKLAPAAEVSACWVEAAELEWLSSRGECRQQVAWFGPLARYPGQRSATVVAAGSQHTLVGSADEPVPLALALGRYVYEPDAAVLAAKLTGAVCRERSLAAVAPGIAYLTSDALVHDPALDAFDVRDVLPLDRKQLKAYCRQHRLGRLEVKKRGCQIDPERLRQEVAAEGHGAATLLVAPLGGQTRVIVAQRLRPQTAADEGSGGGCTGGSEAS